MALRETRPVTFTRCGYAICIPRLPTMTRIFRPLSDAAANKENSTTPRALSSSLPTLATYPIRVLTIRLGLVAAIYLGLRYLISLQTKKQMQATSVADTGMPSPPRLIPPPFTPTSTHYCLGGHALPRPASRFATKQFAATHRSSIDLSHLLSSGAASRFQNAPRCSGVEVRMAADRVRCHVRLTPHRFFVRQSSDFDCAIEVVLSR